MEPDREPSDGTGPGPRRLVADCSRCAALCCVAFAFERSDDFAIDKAAGEPCRHLNRSGACRIYDTRLEAGFGGCIRHDCLGAGQRVVQETFEGRSWLSEPDLLEPMSEAFATMWAIHKALALLSTARKLALSEAAIASMEAFEARLEALAARAADPAARGAAAVIDGEIARFLPELRGQLPDRPGTENTRRP